jgi:hypothetical protein
VLEVWPELDAVGARYYGVGSSIAATTGRAAR